MASKTITIYSDDIDGSDAEGTVRFALDGSTYEIDLNGSHNAQLRAALGPYIAAARKAGGKQKPVKSKPAVSRPPASSNGNAPANGSSPIPVPVFRPAVSTTEIRSWAKSKGYEIKDRGRIPDDIAAKYKAAH